MYYKFVYDSDKIIGVGDTVDYIKEENGEFISTNESEATGCNFNGFTFHLKNKSPLSETFTYEDIEIYTIEQEEYDKLKEYFKYPIQYRIPSYIAQKYKDDAVEEIKEALNGTY